MRSPAFPRVAWLSVLLLAAPVHAQEDVARTHFERGVALHADGQFAAALAEFEASYAASPRPRTLFNIAQLHARLGHAVESTDAFERYLAGDRIPADQRALAETELATQRARVAWVRPTSTVSGVTYTLDDVPLGQVDGEVRVSAGEHVLSAAAAGFEPVRRRFRIAGGDHTEIAFQLTRAAQDSGMLRLQVSVPGARVRLDDEDLGLTPLVGPQALTPGAHELVVERPGYRPHRQRIELAPRAEVMVQVSLERDPSGPTALLALRRPSTAHRVLLDGAEVPLEVEVAPGLHDLVIEASHLERIETRLDVPPGGLELEPPYRWTVDERERRREGARSQQTVGLGVAVGGGVVALAGAGLLVARVLVADGNRYGERQDRASQCMPAFSSGCTGFAESPTSFVQRTNDLAGQLEVLTALGVASVAVGGVALLAGVVLASTAPSDAAIDRAVFALRATPGGLSLEGGF